MKPQWIIVNPPEEQATLYSELFGLNPHLARVLPGRGIVNVFDAYRYLSPRLSSIHSPFLMKDMDRAVLRIRSAVENGEQVGVFADSDLDGLTSLTLILRLLRKTGLTRDPYVRYPVEDDDYGLSRPLIDDFAGRGVNLLITLDSGIRDVDEIRYARGKGIDVLVCDHHEQGPELPEAIIVNPKQSGCPYPFKELAGVGVAFKLCQGLLLSYLQRYNKRILLITEDDGSIYVSSIKNRVVLDIQRFDDRSGLAGIKTDGDDMVVICDAGGSEEGIRQAFKSLQQSNLAELVRSQPGNDSAAAGRSVMDLCSVYEINPKAFTRKIDLVIEIFLEYEYNASPRLKEFVHSVIDLVALGTIADIMPLRGENRTMIHFGLRSLGTTSHRGLRLLLQGGSHAPTSKSIAWSIAPLLNTPGRLGKTGLTASFFLDEDEKILRGVIQQLGRLNEERKQKVNGLFDTLYRRALSGEFSAGDTMIFVADDGIPEGLCGLVANRLADALNKPVIAVSLLPGKDIVKGSGRAKGILNFFSFVEPFSRYFEKIGGHAQAFGFSVRRGDLAEVRDRVAEYLDGNAGKIPEPSLSIDSEIPIKQIDMELVREASRFEPHGHRNEELLFLARGVTVREFIRMGTERNHGKYLIKGNHAVEAVGWNMADVMEEKMVRGRVDLVFHLEVNEFNGQKTVQMRIVDID